MSPDCPLERGSQFYQVQNYQKTELYIVVTDGTFHFESDLMPNSGSTNKSQTDNKLPFETGEYTLRDGDYLILQTTF